MPARKLNLPLLAALFFLITAKVHSRPNFNVDSLSFIPIPGTKGCWGYVDSSTQKEYALICATNRLEIWDVTDPRNPVQKTSVPASGSDLKQVRQYSHYVLAVNQSEVGLQVIDMTKPESAATVFNYVTSSDPGGAHTVHVDGHYAYLGMNGNSPYSWRIVDLSEPENPLPVGEYMTSQSSGNYRQSHDGYVKGDTAYVAFLSSGFSIVDIRNKNIPRRIADVLYPGAFTHNCWTTEDGKCLFTTDEVPGGHLRVWDIRYPGILDSVKQVAEWKPSGIASIIHNVQVKGNFLFISYYADGVVILDIEDPAQPVEVGHFDTAPEAQPGGNYAGCWDFFPYFPSGTLVASNYSGPDGMALLRFNGATAGKLKGAVSDSLSGLPLQNVLVRFLGSSRQTTSDSAGNFLLRSEAGTAQLEFSLINFIPETVIVNASFSDTTFLGTVRLKPTSLLPGTPQKLAARSDPQGNIHLFWQPPPDDDLTGFLIYGTLPPDTTAFFLLDSAGFSETTYVDVGSTPGERLAYRVAAMDSGGLTSLPSSIAKAMRMVFGSKILLVDRTAYCYPSLKSSLARDSLYAFHSRLLRRWDFDTLELNDCLVGFNVNPEFVCRHPVIVLHSSELISRVTYDNPSFLSFFTDYVKAGGKLLVAGHWPPYATDSTNYCDFDPSLLPNANPAVWDSIQNTFGFDCLSHPRGYPYDSSQSSHSFFTAEPKSPNYPRLFSDSAKVDRFVVTLGGRTHYQYPTVPNVGFISNRNPAEDLYSFGSLLGGSDPKNGQTVAKKHIDSNGGGFVWFDFPLYYMKEDSAKKAFRQALSDLGAPENFPKGDFDRDNIRTIADVPYLINWVFLAEPFPIIFDADEADLNCDGHPSPVDVILFLLNIFADKPLPCN